MSAGEDNRPTCLRCGKAQSFVLNRPCRCGCWWLERDGMARHVGDRVWPRAPMERPWSFRHGRAGPPRSRVIRPTHPDERL